MDATAWAQLWSQVALVLFLVLIVYFGAPKIIGKSLDDRAAKIKAELDAAKKYMLGAYAINNLESSGAIAGTLVDLQTDKLGIDYMQRRIELINAVKLDDVKAAARKLLSVEPAIMILGPKFGESKG